jgi:1-deoxy-D-xylulose-5-phosphate synthase
MAPKDGEELEAMLDFALKLNKPVVIRYPRANVIYRNVFSQPVKLGKAELLRQGKNFTVIALGSLVLPAQEAVEILAEEGIQGTLINARFAAPLDLELIESHCQKKQFIFTLEEGIKDSGFGSAIAQEIGVPVNRIGLPLEFIPHGSRALLLEKYDLTAKGIAENIRSAFKKR